LSGATGDNGDTKSQRARKMSGNSCATFFKQRRKRLPLLSLRRDAQHSRPGLSGIFRDLIIFHAATHSPLTTDHSAIEFLATFTKTARAKQSKLCPCGSTPRDTSHGPQTRCPKSICPTNPEFFTKFLRLRAQHRALKNTKTPTAVRRPAANADFQPWSLDLRLGT
jgi:hypothetical protein